jgi:hypothetical protein
LDRCCGQGDGPTGNEGGGSFQVDFLELDITTSAASVPEPGTIALLGLAAIALFRGQRRRGDLRDIQ